MRGDTVIIQGILKGDGVLELAGPIALPPGPVEVTVRAVGAAAPPTGDWWEMLQKVRAEQAARGHTPRSVEEIDAEINAARDD